MILQSRPIAGLLTFAGSCCLAALSQACTAETAARLSTVADSAGITIITSGGPVWNGQRWHLSAEPALQIGVIEGDSAYQLYRVRSAIRLSDGRIVISNDGSKELRYFDTGGRHLVSAGRSGQGPGEFMSMLALLPGRADTVLVGDNVQGRLSYFDADGDYVRLRAVNSPIGLLPDGDIIAQVHRLPPGHVFQNGPARDEAMLIRHPAAADRPDTIARLEGNESVMSVQGSGRNMGATGYPRPYGLRRTSSVFDGRIFTSDGARPEIQVLDPTGALRTIIRFDQPLREVTAADRNAYLERFLGPIPPGEFRNRAESALQSDGFPAFMPVFASLRHDRAGNLWLEGYVADPSDPPFWIVLDPEGRWLGSVAAPAGLRITDIGEDYVLGIARDELDVEHVLLYDLLKEEPASD